MKTEILQIEKVTAETFKNEIINDIKSLIENIFKPVPEVQWITREETAKLLSISLVTLWKWTKEDIIPAYKIGNKVRYNKNEVIASLKKINCF